MVIQKIFIKVQTFVTFVTILWHFWLVVCSCHLLMPAAWKVLRQSDINMEWGKYQNWNGFRNWTNQCQWCIAGYVNGWRLCLIRPLCFEHRTTQDSTQIGKLCICSYCSTKYPCYLFVSSVTKVCKCYKTFLSVRPFWPEWQPIRFTVTVRDPFDLNGRPYAQRPVWLEWPPICRDSCYLIHFDLNGRPYSQWRWETLLIWMATHLHRDRLT